MYRYSVNGELSQRQLNDCQETADNRSAMSGLARLQEAAAASSCAVLIVDAHAADGHTTSSKLLRFALSPTLAEPTALLIPPEGPALVHCSSKAWEGSVAAALEGGDAQHDTLAPPAGPLLHVDAYVPTSTMSADEVGVASGRAPPPALASHLRHRALAPRD